MPEVTAENNGDKFKMKKKTIIISAIAGIFVMVLCVKLAISGRGEPVIESTVVNENAVSDGTNGQLGQEKTKTETPLEAQQEAEKPKEMELEEVQTDRDAGEQDKIAVPERLLLDKPVAKLNGEEGELSYRWNLDKIQIDGDTILFSCDSYFAKEMLQQKIFYLAKAPDFIPQEIFRQDSKVYDEEPLFGSPEFLERRMPCPKHVEEGYVYEADGLLYLLDEEFQEITLLCDLMDLMGEDYLFSPWVSDKNKCDVTADASRLLACTDEGLYEYDLENGERKLLEPAVFTPYEVVHVEGDCDCGETGFKFDGPVEAEYAPDGQSYVFLTGIEYGDPTKATLRSAEGETLYQKEIKEYIGGFSWIESDNSVYLAVFYREDRSMWLDRVDIHTGEKATFAVPDGVLWGTYLCVGFLDDDRLIYCSNQVSETWERESVNKSEYEIYRLSDGEIQKPEIIGEADWKVIVFGLGGFDELIVRYPISG